MGRNKKNRNKQIGERHGCWTIIGAPKSTIPASMYRYKCRCVCGVIRKVFSTSLMSGESKSCGCLHLGRKRPYESLHATLRGRAKRCGHSFSITYQEFVGFTKIKACHYCDTLIEWFEYGRNIRSNLDRKDNHRGYSFLNCVVCCGSCNRTKGDRFTYEEFMLLAPILKAITQRREYEKAIEEAKANAEG